jgi:hypothetical protein
LRFLSAVCAPASRRSSLSLLRFWRRIPWVMSASNWAGRDPSPRAVLSDGSSTPAGLRNLEVGSGPLVLALLLSEDADDGGGGGGGVLRAAGAGAGASPPCSVLNLISPKPVTASRMTSRALLELRPLACLVSFVLEEEPGPKLDIDVSRFEVVWRSTGTCCTEDDSRELSSWRSWNGSLCVS